MKLAATIAGLFFLLLFYGTAFGGFIDYDIFPSEEELYEAFLDGQIDYPTYLNLKDLIESGIDSTGIYLLEEVPNLNYFYHQRLSDYTGLDEEQAEPFIATDAVPKEKPPTFYLRWKRYQKLEAGGLDQNQFYLKSKLSPRWTLAVNGSDDYYGRQEISMRSLSFRDSHGTVKKANIGSYTARFGLGLTVGYRGRLLDKDDLSTEETILYPDRAGFNGFYAEGGPLKNRVKMLFHYDRSSTHLISATALNLSRRYGNYTFEGTLLGAIMKNRQTDVEYDHFQLGLFAGYYEPSFDAAVELALPKGASKDNFAALAESSYDFQDFKLKMSAWQYGRDFKNYFGGGRSGNMSRTVSNDDLDLQFSDRRNNQRGILLKTETPLTDKSDFNLSFSIYGSSRYYRNSELLFSMGQELNNSSEMRLYYEYYGRDREGDYSDRNGVRLEYKFRKPSVLIRSYIGYRFDKNGDKYLSNYFRARIRSKLFKEIEIWLNLSRINIETNSIDYFYGYIREKVELTNGMALALKYKYRYNRNYTDSEDSTLYLEMFWEW